MIVDDAFNSDKLIEFLQALVKDADKKIFLILDNLRVHHSKPVKAWLAEHKEQIEVPYLPSYSPDLNPRRAAQCRPQVRAGLSADANQRQAQGGQKGAHGLA